MAKLQISPGNALSPSRLCPPYLRTSFPYRYWTLKIVASSSSLHASYAISVRQASVLPAASFRFHLTMDTLAVQLTIPPVGFVGDLHSLVRAPCREHQGKRVAGCSATPFEPIRNFSLEAELHTEFTREAVRNDYSARRNERVWCPKTGLPDIAREIVSEIRAISQIEHLEERCYRIAFLDSEVLADSRVELEEWLSSQNVKTGNCALARPQTIAVLHSIGIRGTGIPECG